MDETSTAILLDNLNNINNTLGFVGNVLFLGIGFLIIIICIFETRKWISS